MVFRAAPSQHIEGLPYMKQDDLFELVYKCRDPYNEGFGAPFLLVMRSIESGFVHFELRVCGFQNALFPEHFERVDMLSLVFGFFWYVTLSRDGFIFNCTSSFEL